jgi:uncharacterized membrane protein YqjE
MGIVDSGLTASLRRAARSIADQATLHGELFWVEWQVERSRLLKVVIVWLVSLILASFTLIFASISALAAAWNTPYRVHVGLGLAAFYFAGFIVTRFYLGALGKQGETSFVASRGQLAEEAEFLKSLL